MQELYIYPLFLLILVLSACDSDVHIQQDSGDIITMSSEDYISTLVDAYIYGYPLVLMEYTKQMSTNVVEPHPIIPRAPINQLGHYRKFPDHTSKGVVKPNVDTYYSIAWFDLSRGPQVLSMPATDRYYLLPFYDAFTNVFASLGTRTHGDDALTLLIVGPDYDKGDIADMMTIQSPTNMAWLIARIETYDDVDGSTIVRSIQDRMDLRPLNRISDTSYTPPLGIVNQEIDKLPPVNRLEALGLVEFINQLTTMLADQQSASYDLDLLLRLAQVGIEAGSVFNLPKDNFILSQKLKAIPRVIHERMRERKNQSDPTLMKNNWTMISSTLGDYRDNYLMRSYISFVGLGANLAEDAIYPFTTVDSDGNPLLGSQSYRIHMDASEIPPVKAFWSLTAYNEDDFLIGNEYDKFAINSKDSIGYNDDGSLDLYIGADKPINVPLENWIPVDPNQNFSLTMRLYWPKESIFKGEWLPPMVDKMKHSD